MQYAFVTISASEKTWHRQLCKVFAQLKQLSGWKHLNVMPFLLADNLQHLCHPDVHNYSALGL